MNALPSSLTVPHDEAQGLDNNDFCEEFAADKIRHRELFDFNALTFQDRLHFECFLAPSEASLNLSYGHNASLKLRQQSLVHSINNLRCNFDSRVGLLDRLKRREEGDGKV